jgi:hypothetical protein
VDKLNSLINGSEREMIRLRQAYADAVEHRNMTGIQLIDRNDELCILHEKFNIQVCADCVHWFCCRVFSACGGTDDDVSFRFVFSQFSRTVC